MMRTDETSVWTAGGCLAAVVVLVLAGFAVGAGNTFYVDPVNGSMAGDGSEASPWRSLEEVFAANLVESQKPAAYPYVGGAPLVTRNPGAPVKAGDTILLRSGNHGTVSLYGWFNTEMITVAAETGHTPVLERWDLNGGSNWKLSGLTVSPEPYGTPNNGRLVNMANHSWHGPVSDVVVEDSDIYTVADASSWTATDWSNTAAYSGIYIAGDRATLRNNTIRNISFGIIASGDDLVAEYNTIEHISADGMRGGGDRITFQYNTIRYFYDVDGNHDDAIQFYRGGGAAHNDVIIRGNFIDGMARPGVALSTSPQGIGCFDGPYVNWTIENNVVLVSHYHGISLYDSTDSTIVNNTVLDPTDAYPAWIAMHGTTINGEARNNISTILPSGPGITASNNLDLDTVNWNDVFVDYLNYDVRLLADSPAVDAGTSVGAPLVDIDGKVRPLGGGWDIGAYEYAIPGDANLDGAVDLQDFSMLKAGFGNPGSWSNGDFNADGAVDLQDFSILKANFGATGQSIPEPSSLAIMLLASVALRRRT